MGLHSIRIGVVGAGWNGCHLALELTKEGHDVVIFEKQSDIFKGVSGNFGIRLHKGPHYPRSKSTRDSCHVSFDKFCEVYPDLVVPHKQAIYAQGHLDALGHHSKVSDGVFADVCYESPECQRLDPVNSGFQELNAAFNLDEPSIVIGKRLRDYFKQKLRDASIELNLNSSIERINRDNDISTVQVSDGSRHQFDLVVNATGYQSLVPPHVAGELPVELEVTYQTCIALCYEDQAPQEKPFSFIVMDGWFPCVMPAIETSELPHKEYILTHGSYTILGSFNQPGEGEALLESLDNHTVASRIKPSVEMEISRFWPGYLERFSYKGWKGSVLAKLKTRSEFRSSLTFEKDGVIHIFPGKVSNVFNARDELMLLVNDHAWRKHNGIRYQNGVRYATMGALATAQEEIGDKPQASEYHTSNLQSYAKLMGAH